MDGLQEKPTPQSEQREPFMQFRSSFDGQQFNVRVERTSHPVLCFDEVSACFPDFDELSRDCGADIDVATRTGRPLEGFA